MALHRVNTDDYREQLAQKAERLRQAYRPYTDLEPEVFASPPIHYRLRAEFKVWHEQGQANYAMYRQGEYKKPFVIDEFTVGSELINQLMPKVLEAVNASEVLKKRLFSAEFLTTLSGDALITLIYHKKLDEQWESEARALQETLGVPILGRSRKQKVVLERDYVTERLEIGGRTYQYKQVEGSFTQPNGEICRAMIGWAKDACGDAEGDLLELYCGNGNFTIPLAEHFRKVLATEISKVSVNSAQENIRANGVDNLDIVRLSSEEFTQAIDKVRPFRRLRDIDLDSYNFSTVLVDPPRAGLDPDTCAMVARFPRILYISCNPETQLENLAELSKTHRVERFALFDQFPYTDHTESGLLLVRK
ncbi:tRNA (uridine(54)-C5)-methyltransferase TrmA [Microbulbifer flavimaris]|uniref:tRNA/tmRNA (uracil-C(5))-methyltransferase n=1 Tax=Microbulbifer flavimaris TaxID=1781068 RepID=A0ABX4I2W2_9GAMM|nr:MULTISPECIES: tRNA (uridine(54)-C5)-methyltransferase TrmA [Microbulbifer]KUJ84670.1 tRNA (uracil-5-)-methyltransferase [Microbulbifer sp. ZGT114]PCO06759.1 tRNA (uridine(54)-C5)-methyltransferase TrmA [Microbulbifer flavimaris]